MNTPKFPCFLCFLCFTISAILINLSFTSSQTNEYVYHTCGNSGNFTINSTYAQNLNTLLSTLSSNVTNTNGFKDASIGQNPDRVYGLFLCRGDVSIQFCQTCVDAARTTALQRCPNQKESILYYEKCMIRYSNQSFLGVLQDSPALYLYNLQNITERDREGFNRLLGNLFVRLGREASSVPNGPKFSTGLVNFTSSQTIYGLMQCTTDLSQSDCLRCLDGAKAMIPSCCNGRIGARVISPSCNLRYEVRPFIDSPFQDETTKYLYHHCGETGNFTDSSAYATNLKRLLSSLSSNVTSSNGYQNNFVGIESDRVYGAIMCRGDIEIQLCKLCVDSVMPNLTKRCPWQKESLIWFEYCMLRYSNQPFFSVVKTSSPVPILNEQNTRDPEDFYKVLEELMGSLTKNAARRYPGTLFAVNESNISDSQIYGLVQCTGDLSPSDCSFCLGFLVGQLSTCCKRPTGGSLILPSCYLKYGIKPFYELRTKAMDLPPVFPSLPPTPSLMNSTPPSGDSGKGEVGKTVKLILIPSAITIGILLVGALFCFFNRQKFKRLMLYYEIEKRGAPVGIRFKSSTSHEFQNGPEVNCFSLTSILAATDCFSAANKLGEGGFGPVYQGTLLDGHEIAVKRLSKNSGQGLEEFMNEVTVIAKLQHKNLVRLLGCCIQEEEKMLVYEYMPNKSLDKHLFDPSKRANLDWNLRYHIIEGIAQGILYLHKYSRLRIIHRDLKASNILLDDSMNPKISDFGMARIFGGNQTEANTGRVVGTYGYMPPEYALNGLFSEKSDVFSFGVLLIEIISNKRNTGLYPTGESPTLLGYAWELWKEGKALELMDESIRESHVPLEVLKCVQIGLLCIQEDPTARPTMSSIVSMFGNHSSTLPLPKHPGFFLRKPSTMSKENCSINEVTITCAMPR